MHTCICVPHLQGFSGYAPIRNVATYIAIAINIASIARVRLHVGLM